jgi:hypothetical protein
MPLARIVSRFSAKAKHCESACPLVHVTNNHNTNTNNRNTNALRPRVWEFPPDSFADGAHCFVLGVSGKSCLLAPHGRPGMRLAGCVGGGWLFAKEGLFQVDHRPACAWRFVSPSALEPKKIMYVVSSASGQTCFGDKLDCVVSTSECNGWVAFKAGLSRP